MQYPRARTIVLALISILVLQFCFFIMFLLQILGNLGKTLAGVTVIGFGIAFGREHQIA